MVRKIVDAGMALVVGAGAVAGATEAKEPVAKEPTRKEVRLGHEARGGGPQGWHTTYRASYGEVLTAGMPEKVCVSKAEELNHRLKDLIMQRKGELAASGLDMPEVQSAYGTAEMREAARARINAMTAEITNIEAELAKLSPEKRLMREDIREGCAAIADMDDGRDH